MRSRHWEKHPPTLEALAKGMGNNLSDGPCMCSRCTCHGPNEMEKFEIRMREIVTWLLGSGRIKTVEDTQTDKAKEVLYNNVSIAGQLCQAAEMGNKTKITAELHHLECLTDIKSIVATELVMIACQHGKLDVVRCLIEEWSADQFGESVVGGNTLTYAAGSGQIQVVKYLINEDPACIDFPCRDGFTPLMFATFWSRLGVMAYLLSKGADLSIEDKFGRTALSYAALYGNVDAINCLCEGGSDIYHTDHDGKTPLELAKSYSRCAHVIAALTRWQKTASLRKKLKDRSSKRTIWGSIQSPGEEVDRKIADQHMEELIKEIEEEEILKNQKKEKKSKKKKRSGSAKSVSCESINQGVDSPRLYGVEKPGIIQCNSQIRHDAAYTEIQENGGASSPCRGDNYSPKEPVAEIAGTAAVSKPPFQDDPGFMREYWGFILQDAAKCRAPDKQQEYLECIPNLMKECREAGISIKYGKKVLSRLERVAAAREQLELAVSSKDPNKIAVALANAKGLGDMIEPKLWQRAEAMAEQKQVLESDVQFWCEKMIQTSISQDSSPCAVTPGLMQQQYESWHPPAGSQGANHSDSTSQLRGSACPIGRQEPPSNTLAAANTETMLDLDLKLLTEGLIGENSEVPNAEEGLEKETECMVCMESRKSACCIPCGHISMCYACASEVHSKTGVCPICRSLISFVMRIQ